MGAYLELLRPRQWIKNLAVLGGPAFGFPSLSRAELPWAIGEIVLVFACFCLASSACYAINDTLDRKADSHHPTKRHRPVARGAVSPFAAVVMGCGLIVAALVLSISFLPMGCAILVVGYFLLISLYSLSLKSRILLDVIVIAAGFVIRASAGGVAIDVDISPWLIACTFTVCMFLGFGKRRCEQAAFNDVESAMEHRATLLRYTPELLNHLISVSAGIAIMTFLLYTMDRDPLHQPPFNKQYLLYTLPLVCYGVFRYAMRIESGDLTGPTEMFFQDRPLQATILLWTVVAVLIVYERPLRTLFGID